MAADAVVVVIVIVVAIGDVFRSDATIMTIGDSREGYAFLLISSNLDRFGKQHIGNICREESTLQLTTVYSSRIRPRIEDIIEF